MRIGVRKRHVRVRAYRTSAFRPVVLCIQTARHPEGVAGDQRSTSLRRSQGAGGVGVAIFYAPQPQWGGGMFHKSVWAVGEGLV